MHQFNPHVVDGEKAKRFINNISSQPFFDRDNNEDAKNYAPPSVIRKTYTLLAFSLVYFICENIIFNNLNIHLYIHIETKRYIYVIMLFISFFFVIARQLHQTGIFSHSIEK